MMRVSPGFTLIEALVAAGLLVTAALGTAQLFALATAQNAFARQQLIMSGLVSAKIDALAGGLPGAAEGTETIVESGRPYACRWRVVEVPGYGTEALAITVVVSPVAGAGGEVRFTSIRLAAFR
jgi:type II secretory pathway pseudopilin PulG